jgi:hypothetical protein
MSTAPIVQLASTSVDRQGISLVTATKSATDPTVGKIYDPVNLAAAVPIFFHDLGNNSFVGVFSRRWKNATVAAGGNPANFSAYTEDTSPSWAIINSITGQKTPISGSFAIPMTTPNDSHVVVGGLSVPPNYLYLLNTVINGGAKSAVIQHFMFNYWGVTSTLSEETIPLVTADSQNVLFSGGMYFNGLHVIVIGVGQTDQGIYLARKTYGMVGATTKPWEYQSAKGWSTDASQIAKVLKTDSTPLTTLDACSGLIFKGREFLSTVQGATDRTGVVYAKKLMQWSQVNTTSLGTAGITYLGPLYLQPALGANPAAAVLANQANGAAVPFVISQLISDGTNSAINVAWDLQPITRI